MRSKSVVLEEVFNLQMEQNKIIVEFIDDEHFSLISEINLGGFTERFREKCWDKALEPLNKFQRNQRKLDDLKDELVAIEMENSTGQSKFSLEPFV